MKGHTKLKTTFLNRFSLRNGKIIIKEFYRGISRKNLWKKLEIFIFSKFFTESVYHLEFLP